MQITPYLIISAALASTWEGTLDGENMFHSRQTLLGQWAVSLDTVREFPTAFLNQTVRLTMLDSRINFPQSVGP